MKDIIYKIIKEYFKHDKILKLVKKKDLGIINKFDFIILLFHINL